MKPLKALSLKLISLLLLCSQVVSASPDKYIDPSIQGSFDCARAAGFQLITHGRPGELFIEGEWKNAAQVAAFLAADLRLRRSDFRHLNIYGCEFAKGEKGRDALLYLQKTLGVTIAASDDITGRGGDWELEAGTPVLIHGFENYQNSLQCPVATAANDTDGDGIPDAADVDDDNDGISDVTEGLALSANTIFNGNFGTNGGSGGHLNYWGVYPAGTTSSQTWAAENGGAVTYVDGAETYNLFQGISYKTANTTKNATFSVGVYAINTSGGSSAIPNGWGKVSFWLQDSAGNYLKMFTVFNPRSPNLNTPAVQITDIHPSMVQNLAVNGNYSARSFATSTYATISVVLNTNVIGGSGLILAQRNNGASSGPNGQPGGDDFFVDNFSYVHEQGVDTDNDGVFNHLDLDSDNDGIPDAIEAGGDRTLSLTNCRIPYTTSADTDANGDGCKDGNPSTTYASPNNTDGADALDYLDLDSDNDGCPDAVEAGNLSKGNVNTTEYEFDNATSDGLTNAGCSVPNDDDWLNSAVRSSECPLKEENLSATFGSFDAFIKDGSLYIKWQTLREENVSRFDIEASADGNTFNKIGSISSKAKDGCSDTALQYEHSMPLTSLGIMGLSIMLLCINTLYRSRKWLVFLVAVAGIASLLYSCSRNDEALGSKNDKIYLRIKETDKDGNIKYSKTIKVIRL